MGKTEEFDPNALDKVEFKDIKNFSSLYWLITTSCIMNYICMFVFLQFAQTLLIDNFLVDKNKASQYLTIPYMMAAVVSPFVGFLIDRVGNRQWFLLGSTSLMVCAHCWWLFEPSCVVG